jgi:hypothetical protein
MAFARQSLNRWWMVLATAVWTVLATADASTCEAMDKGRPAAANGITGGGPESPVPVARWRKGSNHPPHRRPPAVPKVGPSCAPNDDTTSGDPDEDDDDPSSFLNDPDDTDASSIAWLADWAPCPIPRECAPPAWIAPPTSSRPRLERLRC